jgi:hypothetical protein
MPQLKVRLSRAERQTRTDAAESASLPLCILSASVAVRLALRLLLRRGAMVEYALNLVLVPFRAVNKGADSIVNQHGEYNRDTESEGNFLSYHMACWCVAEI